MKSSNMQNKHSIVNLKNFGFLVPHLPEFEGELQDLLFEIDKLIERKKTEWETELQNLERRLQQKIKENQELQSLIVTKETELKEAAARLNVMEYTFPEKNPEDELNAIKTKVDKMRRSYETLQKKYRRQLDTEKEQSSLALRQLEQANTTLKAEMEELRETSKAQMDSLKMQLELEKLKTNKAEKRSQNLQLQLDELNTRAECERSEHRSLEETYHTRCLMLESELETTKRLSGDQITEIQEVKQKSTEQTKQINRLTSDLQTTQTNLTLTGDALCRVEYLVLQQLATFAKSGGQRLNTDFPQSNPTPRSTPLSRLEVETKLKEIEQNIELINCELMEKFNEMRRLESACQTASGTIHRLVEARTNSMNQVASLSTVLNKTVHEIQSLLERVGNVEHVLSEKLDNTKGGLAGIKRGIEKLRTANLTLNKKIETISEMSTQTCYSPAKNEVAVQTAIHVHFKPDSVPQPDFERMKNEWLSRITQLQSAVAELTKERNELQSRLSHQLQLAERLQKENLALSDVLTGAEEFNRTRITCSNPLKHEKASNFKTAVNAEVQVDPWPSDAQRKSTSVFTMRKSLPGLVKSSCTVSRAPLIDSQTLPNTQMLSPVLCQTLSPASIRTNTNTTEIGPPERVQPDPEIAGDQTPIDSINSNHQSAEFRTQFEIALSRSPIRSTEPNRPTSHGDSLEGFSTMTSPSEYENFALTGSQNRPALKSSPLHDRLSLRTRAVGSSGVAQPVGVRRSRSVHIRFPVPDATEYAIDKPVVGSKMNPVSDDQSNVSPVSVGYKSELFDGDGQDTFTRSNDPFYSQPRSNLCLTQSCYSAPRSSADYENDDADDVSVYSLAAKFLADEKKYSARLEQQIDAHLEVLKSQFGLQT